MIEFYFKNIHKRWEQELAKASGKVIVFSPYLTSETALQVLEIIEDREQSEIYTKFSAQDLINGSSSLATLKQLLSLGLNLYELPNIHAKIILVPGVFVSIGSQNLTFNGTLQKEANVIILEPQEIAKVESRIKLWIDERELITNEMVIELEKRLYPLREKYQNFYEELHEIEQFVKRQQEIVKEQQEQKERRDRIKNFRSSALCVRTAKESIICKVKKFDNRYYSLLTDNSSILTSWVFEETPVDLSRYTRYLCFNLRDCSFGWVRLVKTRITYVHSMKSGHQIPVTKWNLHLKLKFRCIKETHHLGEKNLEIAISIYDSQSSLIGKINIFCWFSVNDFDILYIKDRSKLADVEERVVNWIKDNEYKFKKSVLKYLTAPFNYKKKMIGNTPLNMFFGQEGTEYFIQLGKLNNQYLIIANYL